MDNSRLNTLGVLQSGILDRPCPTTDIPTDREEFDPRDQSEPSLNAVLDAGTLLHVPEYYGIVYAWKDDTGYHGRLLQYRNVTESPDFATVAECVEWFTDTVAVVTG